MRLIKGLLITNESQATLGSATVCPLIKWIQRSFFLRCGVCVSVAVFFENLFMSAACVRGHDDDERGYDGDVLCKDIYWLTQNFNNCIIIYV